MTTKTKQQTTIALNFSAAFAACNKAKTKEEFKAAEPELDRALVEYKKAHNLAECYGLLDCINHFNQTYANS